MAVKLENKATKITSTNIEVVLKRLVARNIDVPTKADMTNLVEEIFKGGVERTPTLKSYTDLISDVANVPPSPQGGWTTEKMRSRLRIQEVCEEGAKDEFVYFKNEDFREIKETLKTMNWAFPHKDFVAFDDYVNSLSEDNDVPKRSSNGTVAEDNKKAKSKLKKVDSEVEV